MFNINYFSFLVFEEVMQWQCAVTGMLVHVDQVWLKNCMSAGLSKSVLINFFKSLLNHCKSVFQPGCTTFEVEVCFITSVILL